MDGASGDDQQMMAIQAKKGKLGWEMIGLIIASFATSAAVYGLTLWQNPDLNPTRP